MGYSIINRLKLIDNDRGGKRFKFKLCKHVFKVIKNMNIVEVGTHSIIIKDYLNNLYFFHISS